MAITKTWHVNSGNSRHPQLDGESVGAYEPFSNGLQFPGDPSGGVEEVAGCLCTVSIEGESWVKSLTPRQYEAVNQYGNGPFQDVNGYLRHGDDFVPLDAEIDELDDIIKGVDEAIEKAMPLPNDITVHRFVSRDFADSLPGQFTDKAFTSTSFDIRFIEKHLGERNVRLEIIVPKGMRGIHPGKIAGHQEEAEFLLPRGTRFSVIRREGDVVYIRAVKP